MSERRSSIPPAYQQLLSDLGVGIAVVAPDGTVLETNGRARELIRVPAGFVGGIDTYELVDEIVDEHEQAVALRDLPVVRALATGESVTGSVLGFRAKDRSEPIRWLLMGARLVRDESTGGVSHVICPFVDITEQRATRASVHESERRFRLLAENAAEMIFRVRLTPVPEVEFVNAAVHRLFGYTPQEFYADFGLAGRVVHPDDRAAMQAHFLAAMSDAHGEIEPLVVRIVRRDGSTAWAEYNVVPVFEGRDVVAFEGIVHDVTEIKATVADLSHQALHDPLTGLANRAKLLDAVERALARTHAGGGVLAVLYVDLDRFKTVNDNLGHDAGDRVLVMTGVRIADAVRPSDLVARIGGDEFAAVLPNLRDEDEGVQVACRLLDAISAPMSLDAGEIVTTASIGATFSYDGTETPAELLRQADLAMYQAKDIGRARVERYARPEPGRRPAGPHG